MARSPATRHPSSSNRGRSGRALPSGVVAIGSVLPQLMARYGANRRAGLAERQAAWERTVGAEIARVTRLGPKKRGVLEVFVPHHAYVQELSFREHEFVAALATNLPEEKIVRIKFRAVD